MACEKASSFDADYSNRVGFLLLVGILAAAWASSGVTNPARCQCQPRNCRQINTSGNRAETLQHPSKAFTDHFWSEGCIKCFKGCIDVVDIWESGDVLNWSKCKFDKVSREKYTHLQLQKRFEKNVKSAAFAINK